MTKLMAFAAMAMLAAASPALASGSDVGDLPGDATTLDRELLDLQTAFQALRDNDEPRAEAMLKRVIADPAFADLDAAQRHAALIALGAAEVDAREFSDALSTLTRATAMTEADQNDWFLRLHAASGARDIKDQVLSLTRLAQSWPSKLNDLADRYVLGLPERARAEGVSDDARINLLQALAAAGWKPQDSFLSADTLWSRLVEDLLDRGQIDDARKAAAGIRAERATSDLVRGRSLEHGRGRPS